MPSLPPLPPPATLAMTEHPCNLPPASKLPPVLHMTAHRSDPAELPAGNQRRLASRSRRFFSRRSNSLAGTRHTRLEQQSASSPGALAPAASAESEFAS